MLALSWLMLAPCWLMLASSWLKLAHVGLMLAQVGLMLAQVGLKDGSRCLYVGSSWPQDAQNGLQEPPRASKMSQNAFKMLPDTSQNPKFDDFLSKFEVHYVKK